MGTNELIGPDPRKLAPALVGCRVFVLPATVDASELAGMLKRPAKPVTVTEMN